MDKLDPLRDIGMDVDRFPERLQQHLQTLTPEEIRVLATLQKKAVDAGVGTTIPSAASGTPGNCYY